MTKLELEAKVAELEAKVAELTARLAAKTTAPKTETEKDSFGCRAGTAGFEINKVISGLIERNRKLDPKVIHQALGGQIELRRIKQQLPYLKGKGLI